MVDIGILYRYAWRDEPRAMHARYIDGTVTVTQVHPVTCVPIESHGEYTYAPEGLTGDGDLADTHRRAIAVLIAANLVTVP